MSYVIIYGLSEPFTVHRQVILSRNKIYPEQNKPAHGKIIDKPLDDINYSDSNRKMYKKRSEIVLQMDEAIDEFMMFLSTKPIVTWSICTGHGLLSILTWNVHVSQRKYRHHIRTKDPINIKF